MDANISVSEKALVDKTRNKVVLVESGKDFVDVLFSFLTMPMGTIIILIGNAPPTVGIGCMNNLYESVENLDATLFHDKTKEMLLHPQNAAANCLYKNYPRDGTVFLNGMALFIVTDKLLVMPASTAASVSLLTEHGVKDASAIEETTFDIGVNEVLILLKCSLVSKTPLTDTLLPAKIVSVSKEDFKGAYRPKIEENESIKIKKISVSLVLSKSRNMLCYAEASDDFVDLVFSLLTIPLGCFAKEVLSGQMNREILLSPKIANGFGIEKQLLRLKEAGSLRHYREPFYVGFPDRSFLSRLLSVVDPESSYQKSTYRGGFVQRPGLSTVADSLIITPISPVSGVSVLKEMKVPFSDVEERVVLVGYEEAARLMIASMVSESALSDTFIIPKQPKNAKSESE